MDLCTYLKEKYQLQDLSTGFMAKKVNRKQTYTYQTLHYHVKVKQRTLYVRNNISKDFNE